MSRDSALAIRASPARESFDRLLEIAEVGHGDIDFSILRQAITAHYECLEVERRGVVRSMQILSEEAMCLTRDIREQTTSHLQAILDNVKDAILTLDYAGHIETFNPTGEKIFGYSVAEILGRSINFLLPEIDSNGTRAFLDSCASRSDDTHTDLAAHQTWGVSKQGKRIPLEVSVSSAKFNGREGFILCIRDCTERHFAEKLIRDSETRAASIAAGEHRIFEKIAANAALLSILETICAVIQQVVQDASCAISFYDAETKCLNYGVAPNLTREFVVAMDGTPTGIRFGSCAAAVYLARQVIVADVQQDALWEYRRDTALAAGLKAAWSTPIIASQAHIVGTLAVYRRNPGLPASRDYELIARMTQIAGIAIERRSAEDALRESEARFRGLFENIMEGVYQTTREGQLRIVNPAFVKMLGFESAEEICRVPASDLYWQVGDRDTFLRRIETAGFIRDEECRMRRKDGSMLVAIDNCRVIRDKRGLVVGLEGTIVDITERKKAETAVFKAKERAQVTLQSIGDAVITTDSDGRIDYMNPVAESLTGWENHEAQSHLIGEVLTVVDDVTREASESPVMRCLRDGQTLGLSEHTVLINRREQQIAIQDSAAPIRDRDGNLIGAVMVFHDISKERRLHRALHYQASHDALTGLINRREFENRLTAAVDGVQQGPDIRHALLYLDLDQFKLVNDTCGHPAGDQLLRQITGVLQSRVRSGDSLARLGGDEFGVLLQHCVLDQAMRIAETLRQSICDFRFTWQERTFTVGVSIGIVEITQETSAVADVMSAADVACYSAKDRGRNRVQLYKPDDVPERHREMHWVSRLTRACDESRFELYFQPIVPIVENSREYEHFELMLRLRDDSGRLVVPSEFIPAAERYNVMPSIDRWVVRQAVDHVVHRIGSGVKPYTVAVNLSGTSLNDERFLEFIIDQLGRYELSPGALCFEITETAAISNLGNMVYFMRELKARGCYFALDDFGSGLSSFMYLKTLPVDYLKIDGQFIENVTQDKVDQSMVRAIGQIGKAMGIYTIAERVESAEVLMELGRLGIDFAQGFHIAEPRSTDFFPYLKETTKVHSLHRH